MVNGDMELKVVDIKREQHRLGYRPGVRCQRMETGVCSRVTGKREGTKQIDTREEGSFKKKFGHGIDIHKVRS